MVLNKGATPRLILFVSGVVAAAGAIATAYAETLVLLYVTYGVVLGVALGFGYTSSLYVIGRRFDRKRPLALGLAYTGSQIGGFVLAPLFAFTLEELRSILPFLFSSGRAQDANDEFNKAVYTAYVAPSRLGKNRLCRDGRTDRPTDGHTLL